MLVLTGSEMREADRRTIEDLGVPARSLMENAGQAVVRTMARELPDLPKRRVAVICGKGNNGGDGLVVLRSLASQGVPAKAWVLSSFEDLSGDVRYNLEAALEARLPVEATPDQSSWRQALGEISKADVIVDAILGTGLTRAAAGLLQQAIRDINELPAFKVAVDVPSGLSSDTGEIHGLSIAADLTVALAAPKVCHLVPPASLRSARLEVVDIGIPKSVLENVGARFRTIAPDELREFLPRRKAEAHKGDFGHLLIVGGSVSKPGAAVMAAHAALRAGVGLVTVAAPRGALSLMAPALPEAMWEPLDQTAEGAIAASAHTRLQELLGGKTSMAIGPGLGQNPETVGLLKRLVVENELPIVVDADGLNAYQEDVGAIPRRRPLALTPHPGEAGRLLGCAARDVQKNRLESVRKLAEQTDTYVLLKGYRTLVCDPPGNVFINLTGNPGLATGGSGDVLTGIVGALINRLPVDVALRVAAYLHGLAGDLAAAELGQTSLIATDVIHCLPKALRQLGAP
jgi:NAD(P)H-hydrate epimerase